MSTVTVSPLRQCMIAAKRSTSPLTARVQPPTLPVIGVLHHRAAITEHRTHIDSIRSSPRKQRLQVNEDVTHLDGCGLISMAFETVGLLKKRFHCCVREPLAPKRGSPWRKPAVGPHRTNQNIMPPYIASGQAVEHIAIYINYLSILLWCDMRPDR